jgi:hypothetical protein
MENNNIVNKTEPVIAKAIKFQRLVLGILLFISYVFQFIPMVIFVGIIILASSLLKIKYTPFFQLYIRIINPAPETLSSEESKCLCDTGADRFASMIGFILLTAGIVLFYSGKPGIIWVLALIVGTLLALAGTTGFCIGTALYGILFRKK